MQVNIAKGVLRIIPNDLNRVATLTNHHTFTLPQCYFTVLGHSQIKGNGLVFSKAVGSKKISLTMKKTEPVNLEGSYTEKNGKATLHISRAALRDQFDLDGTQLKLVFTTDITATAQNL